jgi:hypothetical protein
VVRTVQYSLQRTSNRLRAPDDAGIQSPNAAVLFDPIAGRRGLEMVTRSGGEMRETEKRRG